MIQYRAVVRFSDLQDDRHIYEVGDTFPRLGYNATPERIAELAGSDNRAGYPLIKAVEAPVITADTQDKETPEATVKNAQRGRRSRKKG